jgi:hypothetical protein
MFRGKCWIFVVQWVGIGKKEVILARVGSFKHPTISEDHLIRLIITTWSTMHHERIGMTLAFTWIVWVLVLHEVEGLVNKAKLGG